MAKHLQNNRRRFLTIAAATLAAAAFGRSLSNKGLPGSLKSAKGNSPDDAKGSAVKDTKGNIPNDNKSSAHNDTKSNPHNDAKGNTHNDTKSDTHKDTKGSSHKNAKGPLNSLKDANSWINTTPLSATSLAGKVVLIDFCTYSCINWLRTLPYIRAWSEKYKDKGLVVIGIHTPEFEFEHNLDNIRPALKTMRVEYPIAIDNDRSIWNAFDNQYWPALYLLDSHGRIQYHRFGEGDYVQSEKTIQKLLSETGSGTTGQGAGTTSQGAGSTGQGAASTSHELVSINAPGIEAPADWNSLGSGENYLGYQRTENFSSPGGQMPDKSFLYSFPKMLGLNQWALSGKWTTLEHVILLDQPNGQIGYQFHARDLHLVMGPKEKTKPVRFKVLIDGGQPGAAHGTDVNEEGFGTVSEPRLYQLIRQSGPITDRRFDIEFLDPGLEAFSFTFG